MELILDEKGRKELDRLWIEFDYIGDFTARTWVQYYFNQSGEVQGKGRESGTARPSDKAVSAPPVIFGLRDAYIAKAEASEQSGRAGGDPSITSSGSTTLSGRWRSMRVEAEPQHLDALVEFRGARLPPAAVTDRNATRCWPTTGRFAKRAA